MSVRVLNLQAVQELVDKKDKHDILMQMAQAFIAFSKQEVQVAPVQHLGPLKGGGDFCVKSGYIKGGSSMVVKIAGGGFGTGSHGCIQVFSQLTGELQAILNDHGWLTDVRTAAAGALCVQEIALRNNQAHGFSNIGTGIGVVGTGVQAMFQAEWAARVTGCKQIFLYGRDAARRNACVKHMEERGLVVIQVQEVDDLPKRGCRLIISCTSSKATAPVLHENMELLPGTVIVALGADGIGKQEVARKWLDNAELVVVDSRVQCFSFGDTSYARNEHSQLQNTAFDQKVFELGELLAEKEGEKGVSGLGYISYGLIVVDLTGIAAQDIAMAELVLLAE